MVNNVYTFIKKNILLIGVIILLVVVIRVRGTNNREYKREISRLSDSIAQVDAEYRLMEDRVSAAQKLTLRALYDAAMFEDSMRMERNKIKTNNIRHVKEIAALKRIPTDTLYLDYIQWLDSISFE